VALVKNISGMGRASNDYGYYALNLPKGNYEILFSFLGHQTQTVNVILTSDKVLNIALEDASLYLREIVITGNSNNENIRQSQMGVEKISV